MKILTLFTLICTLILSGLSLQAQIPQSFNYQAIARQANGTALANTGIAVRINLNTLISGGTTLYSERHDVTTNAHGLFTIQIGSGIVLSGSFGTINWATGAKFVETALDANGSVGGILLF